MMGKVFDGPKCSSNSAFAPLAKIRQMGSKYRGLFFSSLPCALQVSREAIRDAGLGKPPLGTSPQRFSVSFLLEGRQSLKWGRMAGLCTHLLTCSQ